MANPKDKLKKELENMGKLSKLVQKMPETKKIGRKAEKLKAAMNKGIAETLNLEESDE